MVRMQSQTPEIGIPAIPFSLPNTHSVGDSVVSLEDCRTAKALLVAFICNHCPFVINLKDAFADFARRYADKGLVTVAICANDSVGYPADSPENMALDAERYDYPFPYLHDASQQTARDYQAVCTPDFFLYNQNQALYYRGRFDDSTPGNNKVVTGLDLTAAVEQLLADQPAPTDQKPSIGCSIKWR